MDSDEEKIYVSGISRDTDENLFREHFSNFGEVLQVNVIRDKATGLNVGFAFVAFSDPTVVDRVLQDKHDIDNQYVFVKRTSREVQNPAGRSGNLNSSRSFDGGVNVRDNRIFVGGLPPSVTSKELRDYFKIYGPVSDDVIVNDQLTQRSRGFGFVSFDSKGSMDCALDRTYQYLNGTRVEVKRAYLPKDANPGVASGGGAAGGFLVYGGSGGSGYEVYMNSNKYMQPQNTGTGYSPYGYGSNIVGNPGVASGRRRTGLFLGCGGAGTSSGGGRAGASSGGGGGGAFSVYGGSSGSGYEGHMDSNRYMQLQNTGSGYPPYGASGYGGYGYPTGAPYGDPGVPGASGPSSSWGAQVSSSYGNVEYGNAARGGGFGPGSAVREQVGGSAGYGYGGNDSLYGTPSGYGAVDGQSGNIHNTHGSGSGYADASNDSGGYGNHQRNNRQTGYGGSYGKAK